VSRALSAACFALALASVSARAQSPEHAAMARYTRGVELYEARDFEAAIAELRASHELRASPITRLYIARSLRGLDRFAEAIAEYELAEREGRDRAAMDPRYATAAEAAASERAAIEGRVARLRVRATPDDAEVAIGDRRLPAAALGVPIPIDPGRWIVRASAEGHAPAEETIELAAGEERDIELSLARVAPVPIARPERGPALELVAIPFLALGVAAIATGAGFLVAADDRFRSLEAMCAGPCPASFEPSISEGEAFDLAGAVTLASGALFAAIGAILAIAGAASGGQPNDRALSFAF
jgi:hypothetical protein